MYTLVRAIALPNKIAAQWVSVNLIPMVVSTLFSTYRRIVIVATPQGATAPVFIDLEQLRNQYAAYPNTFPVLLQLLGLRELETIPQLPTQQIGYVKYNDVYRCGYHLNSAKRGFTVPDNYPASELPDLELTRAGYATDLSLVHTHCLASVNGYFHQTDTDGTRAYIVDGAVSSRHSLIGHVGLTSFLSVGALSKYTIQADSIRPKVGSVSLKEGICFSIEGPVDNKPFILVLGGYLVFPKEGVFYQTGMREFFLNIARLPYLERILESQLYINLDALALTKSELNPRMVNVEEVWSDAVLRRYLTLSQSFFVSVDAPDLFTNRIVLEPMASPGVFTAYQDPKYPLIVGQGRAAEYWKIHEDGRWAVTVLDSYARNYIFNKQPENTLVNVSDQLSVEQPFYHGQGLLLEIGSNKG